MAEMAEMAEMADDERTLLVRIASGDEEALHTLYTPYRPRIWRYLWRRLDGNSAAIEDALQEIWLAIWRAAPGYRPQGQVAAWVFQIAHHHVCHIWRDRQRRPEGYLAPGALDPIEETSQPAYALLTEESHEDGVLDRLAFADALRRLSSQHREVLELVFHHGFSLAEVAQVLDIPLGTVKSRVSYARRALVKALADATSLEETKL
jgi:RNA polymerase sigma-70 factor (ECF subfamily)